MSLINYTGADSSGPGTLKGRLDQADINTIADALRTLGFGSLLRNAKAFLWRKGVSATSGALLNPYINASALAVVVNPSGVVGEGSLLGLPDDAKAATILRATAIAGTGTPGELTIDGLGTTPAAGHIAVSPNGDIITNSTDAWTSIDVVYEPLRYDLQELTLPVVPGTGVCALPTKFTTAPSGVILVLEAEALVGTSTGKKIILAPAAGAPAAGNARLDLAKANLQFAVADAVTSARVKFGFVPVIDPNALLEAAPGTY